MRFQVLDQNANPAARGDQWLVKDTETDQHYIVSRSAQMNETLAFRASATGEITDWEEVAGCMHGGQSHQDVITELEDRLTNAGQSARDDNVEAAGGPVGAFADAVLDIRDTIIGGG